MQIQENEQCTRYELTDDARQQAQREHEMLLQVHKSNASSLTRQSQQPPHAHRHDAVQQHQRDGPERAQRAEQYPQPSDMAQMQSNRAKRHDQDVDAVHSRQKVPESTSGNRTPKTYSQVLNKSNGQYGNGMPKTCTNGGSQSRSGCVTTRTKYLSNCHKDKNTNRAVFDSQLTVDQARHRLTKDREHHVQRKSSLLNAAYKPGQLDHGDRQYRSNNATLQQQNFSGSRSNVASRTNYAVNSHKSSSVIATAQTSSSQYIKYKENSSNQHATKLGQTAALKPKLAVITNGASGTSAGASTAQSAVSQSGGCATGVMRRVDSSVSMSNTSVNNKKYSTTVLRSSQLHPSQKQHSEGVSLGRSAKPTQTCATHRGAGPTVGSGPMGPLGLKQKKTASPIGANHQGSSSQQRMSHIIASNINYGLNSSTLRQTEYRVINEMINGPGDGQQVKKRPSKTGDASPSSQMRTRSGGSQFNQHTQQNSKSVKNVQQTRNGGEQYNLPIGSMNNSFANQMKLEEQGPQQVINSSRVHVSDRFTLQTRAQQPRVFPKSPSAVSIDANARDRKLSETGATKMNNDSSKPQLTRQLSSSLYLNYRDAQHLRTGQSSRTFALNTCSQHLNGSQAASSSAQQSRCGALASHRAHQRANPSIITQNHGLATSLETISEKRAQLQQNVKKQLEQTQQLSGLASLNATSNSQTKRNKFGQTQIVQAKVFNQTQALSSNNVVNASNKNVKGMSGSREKKKTFSGLTTAPRKQSSNTSALGGAASFINEPSGASGLQSSRVPITDHDGASAEAVSNRKQAKRRDFIQENKRVYTQPKVVDEPKYASQRLRQNVGYGASREVLSSRITPSKQIFRKDKKKNSLSKSPSQQLKQVAVRVPTRTEMDRDAIKKAAQTHRTDQITEILRSLNQSQTGQLQAHASMASKGENVMTFAAAQQTKDLRTEDKTESTNMGVGGTFDTRTQGHRLQVAEEGSRSDLQLREGGCRRGAGMSSVLFGSGVANGQDEKHLQIPKRVDEVNNILVNSRQSGQQQQASNHLIQMTQSSSQTTKTNGHKAQSPRSHVDKGDAKQEQVSFQAAQSSRQQESGASGQQRSAARGAHAGKGPVRQDKENMHIAEEAQYQQTNMMTMQQLAQAVANSAPQSSRRMTAKRDRKPKNDKKENCDAVAMLLRQTAEENSIALKKADQKLQQMQEQKEEPQPARQVLAPANVKQIKEPVPEQREKIEQDPLNDTMVFSEKSSLEDYIIGKQIGQGAYAVVRVGLHRPTNRKVAMKIYKKYKLEEPNRRKSVKREIKLMEKMKHQHIIQLYEIIDTGKYVILVMEYVSNGSLHGYLKSKPNRRLEEWDAKRIFKQIVEGLRYCHSRCITHRDIKLENLLLDEANSMKIIDFGFSTCIPNDKKVKIFCGTPSYMAPEIVLKTEYCGPPADIWALGVLLFTILSGQFPYRGATDEELYDKICRADYHLPKDVKESLSPAAKDLLAKLFSLKASDRPTAKQILEHQWLYHVSEKKEAATQPQGHNDSICQIMPYDNGVRPRAKSQKEAMAPKNKIATPANQQKEAINPFLVEQQEHQIIDEKIIQLISAKLGYAVDEVRQQVTQDLKRRASKLGPSETGTSFVTNLYLRMLDEGEHQSQRHTQTGSKSTSKYMVNQALRGVTARCSEVGPIANEVPQSDTKSLSRSANCSQVGRHMQTANQTQQLMLKSALSQTSLGLSANGNMLSQGLGQTNMQNIAIQPSYVPSLKSLGSNGGALAQTAGSSFQQHAFNNTLTTPFQANLAGQGALPQSASNSRLGVVSSFNNTQPINFATIKEGNNFFRDSVEDGNSSCRTRQQPGHVIEASNGSQLKPDANMNILQMHQTNIFVNAGGANFTPQQQQDAFGFYPCAPTSQENEAETMTDYDNADSAIMSKQSMTINSRCAKSAGNQVRRKTNCWMTTDAAKQAIYEMESVSEEQVSPDFKQRTRVKSGMRI